MVKPRANGLWTRQSLIDLPAWDPTILWYARAIGAMWDRDPIDPLSWQYQGAIHGYDADADPFRDDGRPRPSRAQQKLYWNQCQHFSWYFLPWHRGYLGYFEKIVRSHVVKLGGPEDWALPYWNYSDPDTQKAWILRKEFRDDVLPADPTNPRWDGKPNPLSRPCRQVALENCGEGDESWKQTGDLEIGTDNVSLKCLQVESFFNEVGDGDESFGGPRTRFMHDAQTPAEQVVGQVESTPHGDIHMCVNGWMSDFNTAALDPVFWLHHCNIDRLWEVWRGLTNEGNPSDAAWLRGQNFRLHDEAAAEVTFTTEQMLETASALFAYKYDNISPPRIAHRRFRTLLTADTETARNFEESVAMAEEKRGKPKPRLVGASLESVQLGKSPTAGRVKLREREVLESVSPGGEESVVAAPQQALLNIENVVGLPNTRGYRVYLSGKPGGEKLYVGNMSMFGLTKASDPNQHAGNGLTYVFNVTEQIAALKAKNEWDEQNFHVTFEPMGQQPEDNVHVRVGKISLFYK
jgi:tyrosinase